MKNLKEYRVTYEQHSVKEVTFKATEQDVNNIAELKRPSGFRTISVNETAESILHPVFGFIEDICNPK